MKRKLLMIGAFALAAPAFAQSTTAPSDPIQPTSPAEQSTMGHEQHDAPAANASPTQTTPADLDGDTMDQRTAAEGTMQVDITGTRTGTASVTTGVSTDARTSTGVGGPMEPASEYPVCTRAITDNCLQTPRSPRPPR